MKLTVFSDGGARGNPGPAGCGFIIYDEDKAIIKTDSIYIGKTTNNQAEYKAIIFAFEFIQSKLMDEHNIESIDCFLDSELAVKQINGEYKVKNPAIAPLHAEIRTLIMETGGIAKFNHIPREKNKEADKLANQAMDQAMYLQG